FWTAFFERTHRLSCLAADPNSASPKGTLGWADSVPAVALLGCPLGTGTEEYTPLHHIGFRVSVYRFLIFLLAIFCPTIARQGWFFHGVCVFETQPVLGELRLYENNYIFAQQRPG